MKSLLMKDFDMQDAEYLYNTEVNDCIFDTYMDILQVMIENDVSDEKINEIAKRYHERLSKFNEKDKAYIIAEVKRVITPNIEQSISKSM